MRFELSNAQRKALHIRRDQRALRIALPTPLDEPEDWIEWAESMLPRDGDHIASVSEPDYICAARGANASDDSTVDLLGNIVSDGEETFGGDYSARLVCWIEVVVVSMGDPAKRPRIQWPAKFF